MFCFKLFSKSKHTHTRVRAHTIFGSKIYRKKKALNFIEDISTKGVSPRGRETRGARLPVGGSGLGHPLIAQLVERRTGDWIRVGGSGLKSKPSYFRIWK